ncbi:MAG: electron transfer flavoprotein subunit alpha/FixB family protein [Planctomycetota bacterium]
MTDEVWILAEQTDGALDAVSLELCGWGRGLADALGVPLAAVALAERLSDAELGRLVRRGADRVYCAEHPALARFLPEPFQRVLVDLVGRGRPQIVLAAATTTGRTIMPYVAAKLEVGLTADCTELSIEPDTGALLQTRPAIGGNILATIKSDGRRPQMATVRPHSAPPPAEQPAHPGEIVRITPTDDQVASRIVLEDVLADAGETVNLKDADVVVSAGRGVGKEENVALVGELAGALGAALGASREVVDRGWLPYPHQVGLSGKTIRPRLYVAVGISGAIQHLAGMQTAEHIVAICDDPDAPIFQVADLGVVGDLFQIVPALIERIRGETEL